MTMDDNDGHELELMDQLNDHTLYTNCNYYVQSPSSIITSLSNAADIRHVSSFQSPSRTTETLISSNIPAEGGAAAHYGFLHAKNISYDARSHDTADDLLLLPNKNRMNMIVVNDDDDDDDDDDDQYYYGKRSRESWWKMYLSYKDSDPSVWICLQISWRFLVSFIVALLVFYIASRPPPPNPSIQIGRVLEFELGEGVDRSGVATKMLNCNISLNLIIDNKSKLFGLHINPPTMQMSFHRLAFASTHGPKMYAESGTTTFPLSVGTRNKAMYGAGREMEDMLELGQGIMPLTIQLSFSSTFRVVLNLIRPQFHHQAHCLLLLRRAYNYDKKHNTQLYNSTCLFK